MDYLILRCHPRDTLPFSLLHPTLFCPTTDIVSRKGPSRSRTLIQIPILPSFLFLPSSLPFPPLSSRLHIMKRPFPHNPYAYCTLNEIEIMITTSQSLPNDTFQCGSHVKIISGLFTGVTGTIVQIRNNGDITLKIQQHLGWKFNTCIVKANVLQSLPGLPSCQPAR